MRKQLSSRQKPSTMLTTSLQFEDLKRACVGITKKEIAIQLDSNPLFNYSVESGLTSYHKYTRDELLKHCVQFNISPVGVYQLHRGITKYSLLSIIRLIEGAENISRAMNKILIAAYIELNKLNAMNQAAKRKAGAI